MTDLPDEAVTAAMKRLFLAAFEEDETTTPVGEPLCECGHTKPEHHDDDWGCWHLGQPMGCPCTAFTPAPLSSPHRTRDEGTEDEAAWEAFIEGNQGNEFPGEHNAFVAGFRAARLAGEDDER